MTTTATTAEHTCYGATFCGQPRAAAQAACPACTPPRPLAEVLAEHVDQVRTARQAALEALAEHALPTDAPGAWIRNAIAAELNPTTEETR